MKSFKLIIAFLLTVGLILVSCGNTENSNNNKSAESDLNVITFTSTDIDGNEVSDSIFEGKKLTMINIWATYCSPCLDEMPDLGELNKEYADLGFQIIGIVTDVVDRKGQVIDSAIKSVKTIIDKTGADYIHIIPSESLGNAILNTVIYVPTTIFVDEDGKQIGDLIVGSKTKDKWAAIIDSLLEEVS